jgi:hypothetical protein
MWVVKEIKVSMARKVRRGIRGIMPAQMIKIENHHLLHFRMYLVSQVHFSHPDT